MTDARGILGLVFLAVGLLVSAVAVLLLRR